MGGELLAAACLVLACFNRVQCAHINTFSCSDPAPVAPWCRPWWSGRRSCRRRRWIQGCCWTCCAMREHCGASRRRCVLVGLPGAVGSGGRRGGQAAGGAAMCHTVAACACIPPCGPRLVAAGGSGVLHACRPAAPAPTGAPGAGQPAVVAEPAVVAVPPGPAAPRGAAPAVGAGEENEGAELNVNLI